jgi:hypothetical protein
MFEAWAASQKPVRIPVERPWTTVKALLETARGAGFDLSSSKQVLGIFLALVGYRASPATLAASLIEAAQQTPAESLFKLPAGLTLPEPGVSGAG